MNPPIEELYTRREAASALTVSLRTIDNLIKSRAIACIRIGRSVRFSKEAIQRFKKSRTVTAIE